MARNVIKSIGWIGAGLFSIVGLLFLTACGEPASQSDSETAALAERSDDDRVVHLYFSDSEQSVLTAEQRSLPAGIRSAEAGVRIIQALLEGPKQRLERTIPMETRLRGFYIMENRTAYVDLSSEIRDRHPGGARTELLTIYSIVNTLTMNLAEIETVKILIEGQETTTLIGHMDLRFPLRANLLYVR